MNTYTRTGYLVQYAEGFLGMGGRGHRKWVSSDLPLEKARIFTHRVHAERAAGLDGGIWSVSITLSTEAPNAPHQQTP